MPKAQPVSTCRSSVENLRSLGFLCGLPFDCLDKAFVAVAQQCQRGSGWTRRFQGVVRVVVRAMAPSPQTVWRVCWVALCINYEKARGHFLFWLEGFAHCVYLVERRGLLAQRKEPNAESSCLQPTSWCFHAPTSWLSVAHTLNKRLREKAMLLVLNHHCTLPQKKKRSQHKQRRKKDSKNGKQEKKINWFKNPSPSAF